MRALKPYLSALEFAPEALVVSLNTQHQIKQIILSSFCLMALACFAFSASEAAAESTSGVSETEIKYMKHIVFDDFESTKVVGIIEASKNPAAQKLVDDGVREILKSELGREAICTFAQTPELGVNNFAVSLGMASEILETCARFKTSVAIDYRTQKLDLFPRSIVFVSSSEPARIESYTSQLGTIFIFSTDFTDRYKLMRTLLHEYFVGFDELYAFSGNSKFYLEHSDFKARGKKEDVEKYLKFFALPLVRGTLQMTRALYFENQILAETVGQTTPTHRATSCWNVAKAVAVDVLDVQDLFVGAYALILPTEDRLNLWGGKLGLSVFDELIELEKKAKVRGTLCDLLSKPVLGLSSMAISNGPRPRIGSGTQRVRDDERPSVKVEQLSEIRNAQAVLNRELPFSFPQNQLRPLPELNIKLLAPAK